MSAVSPFSSGEILLRPVADGDAEVLAFLLGALGYPCTPDDARGRVATLRGDVQQRLLLAERGGEPCGLLGLDLPYSLPLGARVARITALVVHPDARRHGVGRHLLREAERIARREGATRLEITSATHRTEAHTFYRACGFCEASLRFVRPLGDA